MPDEPIDAEMIEAEMVDDAGRNLPAVVASEAIVARGEITVDEVVAQKDKIQSVMQRVMTKGVHYGVIPGTEKPTLLKPGAEAILVALRLAPHYDSEKIIDGPNLTVFVKCELRHIPTDLVVGTGEGMCSTQESKYQWRNQKRTCPECGGAWIIKGKAEYGGGWLCWKKAGKSDGCGAKFDDGDQRIESQEEGKIVNPDLPDQWNTVLKMADKRALVAAVLNATAASDVFTQDVEDRATSAVEDPEPRQQSGPPAVPIPKGWAELETLVRSADNPEEAWLLFQAFARAAAYHLFGKTDAAELEQAQRDVLWQKAAGAGVWLVENVEHEGPFRFFDEAAQRKAWATVLDGTALAIPDYVPPEPPLDPAVQAEAERIAEEVFAETGELTKPE